MQDPRALRTVYAGTTEGLYKTLDGGQLWQRMTPADVIVNDVFVDPDNTNHVLLATDRGGVLRSEDGGASFTDSNTGFSARQVDAYASDPSVPATVYVGVVNDKTTGGVFVSHDGGVSWEQRSQGLNGNDVFSLVSLGNGGNAQLLAGTGHGVYRMTEQGTWASSNAMIYPHIPAAKPAPKKIPARGTTLHRKAVAYELPQHRGAVAAKTEHAAAVSLPDHLDAVIYSFAQQGESVYAGTSRGLMRSSNAGLEWTPVSALTMPDVRFLGEHGKMIFAASLKRMALSPDEGVSWDAIALPPDLTQIGAVGVDELGNLWVGGREGVYYSTDYGESWKTLKNLFLTQVNSIFFDAQNHRVLITAANSPFAFAVGLPSYSVTYWDSGWLLRFARPMGDHLVAASLFDGMVIQPRMVTSGFNGK